MHLKDNKNDTFSKINYKAWLLIISKHFEKKKKLFFIHGLFNYTCAFNLLLKRSQHFAYEAVKICKYLSNEWIHVFDVRWSVNIFYLLMFSIQVYAWNSDSFIYLFHASFARNTLKRMYNSVRFLRHKNTNFGIFFVLLSVIGGSFKLDN